MHRASFSPLDVRRWMFSVLTFCLLFSAAPAQPRQIALTATRSAAEGTALTAYRANPLTIRLTLDRTRPTATGWDTITAEIRRSVTDTTAPLAAVSLTGPIGTGPFDLAFEGAQTNQDLGGKATAPFWLVIYATAAAGETVDVLHAGRLNLLEHGASQTAAAPPNVVGPLSKPQADLLYASLAVVAGLEGRVESLEAAGGNVSAAAVFGSNDRLIRSDGTGRGVQASGATLTDAGQLSVTGLEAETATLTAGLVVNATTEVRDLFVSDGGSLVFEAGEDTASLWRGALGAGTVTSVSIAQANGISGSVANGSNAPAITLSLGDITPTRVHVDEGGYESSLDGSMLALSVSEEDLSSVVRADYIGVQSPGKNTGLTAGRLDLSQPHATLTMTPDELEITDSMAMINVYVRADEMGISDAGGRATIIRPQEITLSDGVDTFTLSHDVPANRAALGLGSLATQSGTFSGSHSGSSSGTNTGDQTNIAGNAATATALQTPRAINGVTFSGTANITVPAAAGTLTGSTLAAGVTASSLTSVGTLTGLTVGNGVGNPTLTVRSELGDIQLVGGRIECTRVPFYINYNQQPMDIGNGAILISPDGQVNMPVRAIAGKLRLTSPTIPASASAPGAAGDIAWDASYLYVCTATNTWKRTALATW